MSAERQGVEAAGAGIPVATMGAFLIALGVLSLSLAVVLNKVTLGFLYSDGRLVRDVLSRIARVQAGFGLVGLVTGGVGLLLRSRPGALLPERAINLLLASTTLIYVLASLELTLSLKYPGVYKAWDPFGICRTSLALRDKTLGHVLNPGLDHSYTINRWGFRGRDFEPRKRANEARIVAVGDSITFGWELSEHEATYPGQLERLLNGSGRAGKTYTVVNAGVPRYTSLQASRLIGRVLALDPDLVIVCIGWNDFAFSYRADWYPRISLSTDQGAPEYCRGLSPAILRAALAWAAESRDGPRRGRRTPRREAVEQFEANLKELVAVLRERNVRTLLLNLPSVLSRGPMTAEEAGKAAAFPEVENLALFDGSVREVCRTTGVPCLLDVFSLEQAAKGRYFYDHCHLNEEGNRIVAERVAERIRRDPQFQGLL